MQTHDSERTSLPGENHENEIRDYPRLLPAGCMWRGWGRCPGDSGVGLSCSSCWRPSGPAADLHAPIPSFAGSGRAYTADNRPPGVRGPGFGTPADLAALRAALSESHADAVARAQSAIAADIREAESRARAGADACCGYEDGHTGVPGHMAGIDDDGRVRHVGVPVGLSAGNAGRGLRRGLAGRFRWVAGLKRRVSDLRRRALPYSDDRDRSARADELDVRGRRADSSDAALGEGDARLRYGLPVAVAVAALVLLYLAGCATHPEPASLPVVDAAPIAATAQIAPADTRISETVTPVVTPIWLSDHEGETVARLYDLRRVGGPVCFVVNGGASCDWGAK